MNIKLNKRFERITENRSKFNCKFVWISEKRCSSLVDGIKDEKKEVNTTVNRYRSQLTYTTVGVFARQQCHQYLNKVHR